MRFTMYRRENSVEQSTYHHRRRRDRRSLVRSYHRQCNTNGRRAQRRTQRKGSARYFNKVRE